MQVGGTDVVFLAGGFVLTIVGSCLITANDGDGTFAVLSADRELKPLGGGQLGCAIKKPTDMWHYR